MEPSAALIERHVPLARRLAAWAAHSYRQNFDDVLSDALYGLTVAAYRRPEIPFEAYAVSFIKGYIRHGVRARAGFRAVRERGDDPPAQEPLDRCAAITPGPCEMLERLELWREVDRLPDRERLVVRGHYQLGLSQTELAARLDTTQSAVWRALQRGHRTLAKVA